MSLRQRIAAFTALAGVVCALSLILAAGAPFGDGITSWILGLSAPSAWVGGWLVSSLLGVAGGWGWAGSLLGFALATVIGSAIGGFVVFPGVGAILAPVAIGQMMLDAPLVLISWLLSYVALHLAARRARSLEMAA